LFAGEKGNPINDTWPVCHALMHLRPAKTAERIDVLFGEETGAQGRNMY